MFPARDDTSKRISIKELASVMGRDLRFKAASSERELRLLYQFV
uniref:Uncharacterized protein n=1 Tax=Proteus mirabilis TaxID=584 RepID=A0A1L5JPT7_PROMI|nr:hypothetical protein [Proteus mirabilis]APO16937.1 hypothetical protein [Proteus mirabilis]APO17021.1 hypothetical protein [Proteus mirabilis]APO17116.1 hypothetical protein [Proteus mirabilis]APO17204.1 hypothetical protein [Proteus mirabilis]